MHMTLDEIKELIQVVIDSGVAELEVERGDSRVRIRRTLANTTNEVLVPANSLSHSVTHLVHPNTPPPAPQVAPAHPPAEASASDDSLTIVKSPIVGTYYEASAPGAPPFVKVGDVVQPGQVLCIIESMKLMNEIEAEISGTIIGKLVENGQPVEYGEALFSIQAL
jgi:acetyl-CoA carboxylase biotin carboxyl carrier protein